MSSEVRSRGGGARSHRREGSARASGSMQGGSAPGWRISSDKSSGACMIRPVRGRCTALSGTTGAATASCCSRDGHVIKPLQRDDEVGEYVLVGRFLGAVVLERPEGGAFDLMRPGSLAPGACWPGPRTTGLECAIQPDGSLDCTWYHPTEWGREMIRMQLHPADCQLASGFRGAGRGNPGAASGSPPMVSSSQTDTTGGWPGFRSTSVGSTSSRGLTIRNG